MASVDRTDGFGDRAAGAWGRPQTATGDASADGPGAPTAGGVSGDWLPWALRWFAATLVTFVVAMVAYLALMLPDDPLVLLFPLVLAPGLAGRVVLPMVLAAAALRWLWRRMAPEARTESVIAAILTGVVAGPLALLVWFALELLLLGDGLQLVTSPGALAVLLDLPGPLAPPLLLAGGAAGYLAHHQVRLCSLRWWAVIAATAGLSLLGLELLARLTDMPTLMTGGA